MRAILVLLVVALCFASASATCTTHADCLNGGLCTLVRGVKGCVCATGWSGANCEIADSTGGGGSTNPICPGCDDSNVLQDSTLCEATDSKTSQSSGKCVGIKLTC